MGGTMNDGVCLDCGARLSPTETCECGGEAVEIDVLADLAHRLWMHWSQHIALEEPISDERTDRWETLWVDYDELAEEQQQTDRELVEEMLRYKRHPEETWDRRNG